MGEGKDGLERQQDGLKEPRAGEAPTKEDPEEKVERLEQETVASRENLGDLVDELAQRRHRIARRFGKPIAIAAGFLAAGAIAGLVWWRRRRKSRLIARVRSVLERVAPRRRPAEKQQPSITRRVVAATASAAAYALTRRLVSRALPAAASKPL